MFKSLMISLIIVALVGFAFHTLATLLSPNTIWFKKDRQRLTPSHDEKNTD